MGRPGPRNTSGGWTPPVRVPSPAFATSPEESGSSPLAPQPPHGRAERSERRPLTVRAKPSSARRFGALPRRWPRNSTEPQLPNFDGIVTSVKWLKSAHDPVPQIEVAV